MKRTFDQKELNAFYRYCVALTGDEPAAWDLLQNGLEKWVRQKDQDVRHPKGYFRQILRNRFIDDQRKFERRAEQPFDDHEADVIQISAQSLEEIVATRQEVNAIMQALNPHEREILFLWAVEGYTAQDIADDLATPRSTILSRLYRLRIKIRSRVKKLRFTHGKKIQNTRS